MTGRGQGQGRFQTELTPPGAPRLMSQRKTRLSIFVTDNWCCEKLVDLG